MLRFTKTVIVAALAYAAALVPAYAEKRVALVVGNSAYKHAASLKNPQNDATGMAAALRRLGFRVFEGTDLDRRAMEARIRDFANDIADADVALFYYAGHGLQVNGTNYLAPVDATLKAEADLDFEAIPLKLVLRQMQRSARVNLVFLDACRDNPLAKTLGRASRSLTVGRGLAAVEKAAGMLIAFATQPGNVALDGDGKHSPFTQALLKRIERSDDSINDVMIDVRRDVMAATKDQQVPWENSSLTGRFYFKTRSLAAASGAATAPVAKKIEVADTAMEHTFWTDIQNSNDPKLYRAFLKRFPNGVYAPIAKAKLQKSVRSIAVEARPQPKTEVKGIKVAQLQPADNRHRHGRHADDDARSQDAGHADAVAAQARRLLHRRHRRHLGPGLAGRRGQVQRPRQRRAGGRAAVGLDRRRHAAQDPRLPGDRGPHEAEAPAARPHRGPRAAPDDAPPARAPPAHPGGPRRAGGALAPELLPQLLAARRRQLDFLRNWRLQVLTLSRRWWGGGRGASRAPVFFARMRSRPARIVGAP